MSVKTVALVIFYAFYRALFCTIISICVTLLLSSCGCEKCDFLSSPLASPNDVSNSLLSLKRSLSSSSSCSSSRSPSQYCSRHAQHGCTDDNDDFSQEGQFFPTTLFLNRLTNSKCATCIREALYSFCSAQVRKRKTFCLQVFYVYTSLVNLPLENQRLFSHRYFVFQTPYVRMLTVCVF